MKSALVLFVLMLSSLLVRAGDATPAPTVVAPPELPAPKGHYESFEAKVLQVFSAKDGDALFRAYLVEYKGQPVIASDTLVKSDYKVGDTIRVLMTSNPYPQNRESYGLLAFHVSPLRR